MIGARDRRAAACPREHGVHGVGPDEVFISRGLTEVQQQGRIVMTEVAPGMLLHRDGADHRTPKRIVAPDPGAALAERESAVPGDGLRALRPGLRISTQAARSWNNDANFPASTSLPIEIGTS